MRATEQTLRPDAWLQWQNFQKSSSELFDQLLKQKTANRPNIWMAEFHFAKWLLLIRKIKKFDRHTCALYPVLSDSLENIVPKHLGKSDLDKHCDYAAFWRGPTY